MDKGELVPDELVVDLISGQIQRSMTVQTVMSLDGFPRTIPQAEALDKALAANGEEAGFRN